MDLDEAKARLIDEVDKRADLLLDASHRIHDHPELGYEEVFAHELLTGIVEDEGLAVERHAYGLDDGLRGAGRHERADHRSVLRVRRAARASATPAGTTSSPRPGSGPGWPPPRWPTSSVVASSCWARRPRRAVAARSR